MKTMRKLFILGLATAFILSACKKDDNNDGGLDIPGFTDKTPEQSKGDLEQGGQELLTKIDQFSQEPGVEAMANMAVLTETSDPFEAGTPSVVQKSLSAMGADNHGKVEGQLSASLKSLTETEPSLMEGFNEAAGTYSWNFGTEDWDYTSSPSNAIVFEFPGDETTETNNATLTIDNFTTQTVSETIWDDFEEEGDTPGDLPTSVNITLDYEGATVASLTYTASLQDDGLPTNAKIVLDIGEFSFTAELNHSQNTSVSLLYNTSHAGETILELYGEVKGNWSESNLENEQTMPNDIIHNGNAHYQVMNFKLVGKVNYQSLGEKQMNIYQNAGSKTEQELAEEMAQAMNEDAVLALIYADGSGKIADGEFYAKEYVDEYCYEDWETGEEICEEYGSYWDNAVNLVFSDGSKVDAEVYFSENFDEVINEFNDMMMELEASYY